MLTLEMICALLQGLPADHLDHLDRPWYLLAVRIERALKEGLDPTSALHAALSNSAEWERQVFLRAFLQEEPVLALPVLWRTGFFFFRSPTRRCFSDASSLSQLSRILVQDRSNTRRRLEVLIEKGYAVKYFRRDGAYYLAISSPLDDQTKSKVTGLMQAFKQALIASQDSPLPPSEAREKGSGVNGVTSPTTTTTPTTSTTPTKATASTTATTRSVDVPCPAQPGRNSNATGAFPVANHLPRPP